MKKNRSAGRPLPAVPALIGIVASAALSIIMISIVSALVLNETVSLEHLKFISPCLHFAVLFVACTFAAMTAKQNILYPVIIVLASTYFTCVGMTVLIFDGIFEGFIISLAAGVAGAAAALMITMKKGKTGKTKFRKGKIC